MFGFFNNLLLPEFWGLWGMPVGCVLVGLGALYFSVMIAVTPGARRIGLEVAFVAFVVTAVYELGVSKRGTLCVAQVAAAEARAVKLENKVAALVAAYAVEADADILQEERENDEKLDLILVRLAERAKAKPADACIATDADERDDLTLRREPKAAPAVGKRGRKTSAADPDHMRSDARERQKVGAGAAQEHQQG